jgi:hypothetical protein
MGKTGSITKPPFETFSHTKEKYYLPNTTAKEQTLKMFIPYARDVFKSITQLNLTHPCHCWVKGLKSMAEIYPQEVEVAEKNVSAEHNPRKEGSRFQGKNEDEVR